jgi:hypothetical protein
MREFDRDSVLVHRMIEIVDRINRGLTNTRNDQCLFSSDAVRRINDSITAKKGVGIEGDFVDATRLSSFFFHW